MRKIGVKDFVPPIVIRAENYIKKRLARFRNKALRIHPFDAVPANINVKWVLDVGANVGDVAVAALESYPDAQVICFEPVCTTFEALTKRLMPFAARVQLHNCALSDAAGDGEINLTSHHGANSILPQARLHQDCNPHVRELSKEKIRLLRLDDIAAEFPARKIDIMKVDVEGYELNVLKGGEKFIANNVDVIIIEISLMRDQSWEQQSVFEIFALLRGAGFCLVNVVDVYHAEDQPILLAQMDCVFRHKRELKML